MRRQILNEKRMSPHTRRNVNDIILDLELLCQEEGFIYTYSFITFIALWVPVESLHEVNWHERPNHQELIFILGLMVKHPLNLTFPPNEEVFYDQNERLHKLLEELHKAHSRTTSRRDDSDYLENSPCQDTSAEAYQGRSESAHHMVESFFYSAEGANEYQYLANAETRYAEDSQWIEQNMGTGLRSFIEIAELLKKIQNCRAQLLDFRTSFLALCQQCFDLFSFEPTEIPYDGGQCVENFLKAFSIRPGCANDTLNSIGDYNAVTSHPIVQVGRAKYFFPISYYLARSIYDSPYYWMGNDEEYKDTAFWNRGEATENIVYEQLRVLFGNRNVFRGAKIRKNGQDFTDVDVLAVFDNKAVVIQAKSKKLTVPSRQGLGSSIEADFEEAIQSAFEQALKSKMALTVREYQISDRQGKDIRAANNIEEVYVICVTGDHYPTLPIQVRHYLTKLDDEPYPLAVSIFEHEIISHYLRDPYDYLYYLKLRTLHSEQLAAVSELSLLGLHLENKLNPVDESDLIYADESLSQLVNSDYLISKGHWPQTNSTHQLTFKWRWRDESFDQILECVKNSDVAGVTDAIFLLLDLADEGMKPFVSTFGKLQRATLADGHWHDVSRPLPKDRRGITFICYPQPSNPLELEFFRDHFQDFIAARKYKAYANEWLGLASFLGTSKTVDMMCYSQEPWKSDRELDDLVSAILNPGKALNASGRTSQKKPSRNQPCPCGSGLKYKKCHWR